METKKKNNKEMIMEMLEQIEDILNALKRLDSDIDKLWTPGSDGKHEDKD
jgi:hypothetical protein